MKIFSIERDNLEIVRALVRATHDYLYAPVLFKPVSRCPAHNRGYRVYPQYLLGLLCFVSCILRFCFNHLPDAVESAARWFVAGGVSYPGLLHHGAMVHLARPYSPLGGILCPSFIGWECFVVGTNANTRHYTWGIR
jgi:hypothetical protein